MRSNEVAGHTVHLTRADRRLVDRHHLVECSRRQTGIDCPELHRHLPTGRRT